MFWAMLIFLSDVVSVSCVLVPGFLGFCSNKLYYFQCMTLQNVRSLRAGVLPQKCSTGWKELRGFPCISFQLHLLECCL